jgi:hypothetical protein
MKLNCSCRSISERHLDRSRPGSLGARVADQVATTRAALVALAGEDIQLADQVPKDGCAPSRGSIMLHDSRVIVAREQRY